MSDLGLQKSIEELRAMGGDVEQLPSPGPVLIRFPANHLSRETVDRIKDIWAAHNAQHPAVVMLGGSVEPDFRERYNNLNGRMLAVMPAEVAGMPLWDGAAYLVAELERLRSTLKAAATVCRNAYRMNSVGPILPLALALEKDLRSPSSQQTEGIHMHPVVASMSASALAGEPPHRHQVSHQTDSGAVLASKDPDGNPLDHIHVVGTEYHSSAPFSRDLV